MSRLVFGLNKKIWRKISSYGFIKKSRALLAKLGATGGAALNWAEGYSMGTVYLPNSIWSYMTVGIRFESLICPAFKIRPCQTWAQVNSDHLIHPIDECYFSIFRSRICDCRISQSRMKIQEKQKYNQHFYYKNFIDSLKLWKSKLKSLFMRFDY